MKDRQAVDFYTFVHLFYGYLAAKRGWNNTQIVIGASVYEIVEPIIIDKMRNGSNQLDWNHESTKNIMVDIVISLIGAHYGRQ